MKSFCVLNQTLSKNTGRIIGSAVCAAMGKKIGIAYNSDECSKVISAFLAEGVVSSGGTALMFGCCNESRVAFLVQRYALSACFYVSGDDYVTVCGADGKPINADDEKLISDLASLDLPCEEGGGIAQISSDSAYLSSLTETCGNLEDICADIRCRNTELYSVLRRAFAVAGGSFTSKPCFNISSSGSCVSALDERGNVLTHETLVNICSVHSLMSGNALEVGFTAPRCLEKIAEQNSVSLKRGFKGGTELWQNDGVFLVAQILSIMAVKGEGLVTLASVLPDYASFRRSVSCALSADGVADLIECDELVTDGESGVYARTHLGDVLITPCRSSGMYCMEVIARDRASACELADELCLTIGDR